LPLEAAPRGESENPAGRRAFFLLEGSCIGSDQQKGIYMRWTSAVLRTLTAAGVIGAAACRDAATPVGPTTDPDVQMEPALQAPMEQALQAPDFARLAVTVPGFGGFFLDGGVPTVYLTDVGQRAKAEAALAAYGKVRVLKGDYTHKQLGGWFERLSPEALGLPGAVFVDLDEARNRLFVGVEHAAAAAAVRGVAARLGLPGAAVVVEEVKPVRFAVTLRDEVRPVVGGLQIGNDGGGICTLGFNAVASNGELSFITNSHCTRVTGGTEGTLFTQGPSPTPIGIEVDDPPYFRKVTCSFWGCSTSAKRYRYSDAARVRYARLLSTGLPAVPTEFKIAHTGWGCLTTFCLEIVFRDRISGEGTVVVGLRANKVGRTTGTTGGQVTRTCVDTNVGGTDVRLLCQNVVKAAADGGDSGSPVFGSSWWGEAQLFGIVWGSPAGVGTDDEFWYSPMANIERELGPLQTF